MTTATRTTTPARTTPPAAPTAAPAPAAKKEKKAKDPNKKSKPWIAKRQDNGMRALRALTNLFEKFSSGTAGEARPELAEKTKAIRTHVRGALAAAETAVKEIAGLATNNYKPETEKVKLEVGTPVWLRGAVWVSKYHGLYSAEELKDLKVTAIQGKMVKATSASGVHVVQPSGAFRTHEVDYAKAVEKAAEEKATAAA